MRQTVADMDILKRKLQTLLNTDVLYSPADTILKRIEYTLITDSMAVAQNPSLDICSNKLRFHKLKESWKRARCWPFDFSIGYSSQTM